MADLGDLREGFWDKEEAGDICVGDAVDFKVCYANLVYLTSSDNINKVYI